MEEATEQGAPDLDVALTASSDAPRRARREVGAVLALGASDRAVVTLIVSSLVTDAVVADREHEDDQLRLRLWVGPDHVRGEVVGAPPAGGDAAPGALDRFAHAWDALPGEPGGVWFELR